MTTFPKQRLQRDPSTITVQPGHMWISEHSCAQDKDGKKTHMCWPKLTDLTWLEDVKDFVSREETPTRVQFRNGKFVWHFKLACYHGGEGWWYDFDLDRSVPRVRNYRLFIPRTLQDHPDYLAHSDKNPE